MKILSIYILLALILTSSCGSDYNKEIIEIKIINELQECEEQNLHYTIVEIENENFEHFIGEIILPELENSIKNSKNYELLFPAQTTKRLEFDVKGKFSKQGHNNTSDGCVGAYKFKIIEIIQFKDITDEMNYLINYQ